jgi:hypothetical protein
MPNEYAEQPKRRRRGYHAGKQNCDRTEVKDDLFPKVFDEKAWQQYYVSRGANQH